MRNVIVGLAWLSPFVPIVLWPHTRIAGFVIMAAIHALWLYPTLTPNVQWWGPVITRFATAEREVWLTIDDGPSDDTAQILELLAARGVRATFFVKGKLAAQTPQRIAAIAAAGHTIGNHSYSHPSALFWCFPPPWIASEIDQCAAVIDSTPLFRAPVGMKNPSVHPALARRGMQLIGWTARGLDTVNADPDRVAARIVSKIEPGAILVMHQGREHSVRCIARVIEEVQRAGYAFVIPPLDRLKTNR